MTSGKILCDLKLDELPQLWNVLRGEMSLVADTLPADAKGTDRAPEGTRHLQAEAWHNRPGPVEGIDMSEPEKLAAKDAKYLKIQSLKLDAKIMLRTVWRQRR